MAWSKAARRWSGKPRPRGRVPAAVEKRLDRKLDKRHQWVTLTDTMCEPIGLDCKGCCTDPEEPDTLIRGCIYDEVGVVESSIPNPFPVVLVAPAVITPETESEDRPYQDDTVSIIGLRGYIELCPAFCASAEETAQCLSDPAHCPAFNQFASQFDNYHLRAGLSKDRWEWDPVSQGYSTIPRYPLDPEEWSDAQFMRTWERVKARKSQTRILTLSGSAPLGCCGNVSAAAAGAPANTLSNGSGTVNIPAISTDCEPCGTGEDNFRAFTTELRDYDCIRLSLNSKRKLTFKENEGLTMWIDWTSFTPGNAQQIPGWRRNVGWFARTFVKALTEVA